MANTSNKDYNKQLAWFKERIGKRVYRGKVACECIMCRTIEKEGLIIDNEMHAIYLTDMSVELNIEYRDKIDGKQEG